jgi:hypothetical protein
MGAEPEGRWPRGRGWRGRPSTVGPVLWELQGSAGDGPRQEHEDAGSQAAIPSTSSPDANRRGMITPCSVV